MLPLVIFQNLISKYILEYSLPQLQRPCLQALESVPCSLASHLYRAGNEKPDYMQLSSVYILYAAYVNWDIITKVDCVIGTIEFNHVQDFLYLHVLLLDCWPNDCDHVQGL